MASGSPKYSVLLPTYNERENLPYMVFFLHEAFTAAEVAYEIIVIDDASPDGTQDVAYALRDCFGADTLKVASRKQKLGLGSAYLHGAASATGDYILILDADMSHHPKFIPDFIRVQRATAADIVSGTRYVRGGGVHGWDLRRKLVSRVANYLAQILLRPGVSDLTGSFRLFSADAFRRVMKDMTSTGFVFQMELIVRATRMGLHVEEVPITFVDRLYGKSKLGSSEILQYLVQLWKLAWL